MAYPNLKAEIIILPHTEAIARFADVTERLLYAAVYGNETLTPAELHKIAIFLDCKVDYLTAPVMGGIKPGKKALRRLYILEELIKKAECNGLKSLSKIHANAVFSWAHTVVRALREQRRIVKYAAYRTALRGLREALKMELSNKQRLCVRDIR